MQQQLGELTTFTVEKRVPTVSRLMVKLAESTNFHEKNTTLKSVTKKD
jgi:hypothetical protein